VELLEIKKLNTAIERVMNKEMSKIGLTYTQSSVIGYLIENEGKDICQRDIEFNLGLAHPTVSSVLERMERDGLIFSTSSTADKRYKRLALTQKALNLSNEISAVYNKVKTCMFADISPAERELFNITVKAMLKNIKLK